jgi:succinate dehydrogenase/fumarate reductase flavoprotein subunit
VLARDERGNRVAVRARRGVALCMGSFAANPTMQREYQGYPVMYTVGCPGSTGDGIKMLQSAGAELWHMRTPGSVAGIVHGVKVPEFEAAFIRTAVQASSWIDVAADSGRFYNETLDYDATHSKVNLNGRWVDTPHALVTPIHMIFDERTRVSTRLCNDWAGWNAIAEGYKWSEDNSAELERGWLVKADSLSGLAEVISRDPAELTATVERYNEACRVGHDEEFGRAVDRLEPIEGPPFYALEIVPAVGTMPAGGVRNELSQVVSQSGEPIPRLYEAGELGSTFANLYQNGSFLTEAIAFGRIAGRNVVAEEPWC